MFHKYLLFPEGESYSQITPQVFIVFNNPGTYLHTYFAKPVRIIAFFMK
ncbi:MAG: hypothetical protein HUU43_02660 [Ignavibacteriaceae bacterium]|nr:hypothetical protein [Ignavibacteriaceae bacterium]